MSFLDGFNVTASQMSVLYSIMRTVRMQTDLVITKLPCITFKEVEQKIDSIGMYHNFITRYVGKGYFNAKTPAGKVALLVSCEHVYAEYEPCRPDSYRLYISLHAENGMRRVFRLEDFDGVPAFVYPDAKEIPPELRLAPVC